MTSRKSGCSWLGVGLDILYTSHEADAVSAIQKVVRLGVDGLLLNPAGFLRSGRTLADCLRSIDMPAIEVHMTNMQKRGRRSVTADAVTGVIDPWPNQKCAKRTVCAKRTGSVPNELSATQSGMIRGPVIVRVTAAKRVWHAPLL